MQYQNTADYTASELRGYLLKKSKKKHTYRQKVTEAC